MQARWAATLDDGTTREQGPGSVYDSLPWARVRELRVTLDDGMTHRIIVPKGARVIYFRSVQQVVFRGNDLPDTHSPERVCIGWQQTIRGVNVKQLVWIEPDGTITLADHDPQQAVTDHPQWQAAP